MQLLSVPVLPISSLDRYIEKIQTHKMNKSFDDEVLSDDHNYNNDSSYFYNSSAPSIKKNATIDRIVQQKSLSFGRSNNKGSSYPLSFAPRSTDVIVGKGMNCYNHIGNKLLRNTIVAPKLAQYAATSSKKDKSILVTSILEQVRKSGGAFVKKDYNTGLWHDAEPFLARDKVSQTIRNALNLRTNNNKKRKRHQHEQEQQLNKRFVQMREVNPNKVGPSSFLFGNSINNQSIITQSSDEKVEDEKIHNSIVTMLSEQRNRSNSNEDECDENSDENSTSGHSLIQKGDDDKMLFSFFNRYAESITNEVLFRDNNPLEPNPIK